MILIIAVAGLWFIKRQPKGRVTADRATEAYTALRTGNKKLIYSAHAKCRMACRQISPSEVREALDEGTVNFSKIEENEKGISYPLEDTTGDGQHIRVVFAPKQKQIVVVTAIDLEKDWPCDCQ